ncbi:MAG: serine/threonine protein kinase [Anaerolineae bacterium]|nr:serine/threonine protein kinase [Anaerolineae bacterium]
MTFHPESDVNLQRAYEGAFIENRYRLVQYLAEGGFGAVFRAEQQILGQVVRQVAVKIAKQAVFSAAQLLEILKEAMILAQVIDEIEDSQAKRFLVRVYDLGMLQGRDQRAFIVMEFVTGKSLQKKLEDYRIMPQPMCLKYARQLCIGLSALHQLERPVIHRDLKPDNVLLTAGDEVRIVDFGLAARLEQAVGFVRGVAGTPHYIAPEVLVREESGPASDIYSIGVMLYQLLTGVHPFEKLMPPPEYHEAQARQWVLEQKRRNTPLPPAALNPTVEPRLNEIVMTCLRFQDGDRFPNARALLDAIESVPEVEPEPRDKLLAQGRETSESGRWKDAEQILRKGAELRPQMEDRTQFDLCFRWGVALLMLRDYSKATEVIHWAEAINARKHHLETRRDRAAFYGTLADAAKQSGGGMIERQFRERQKQELGGR